MKNEKLETILRKAWKVTRKVAGRTVRLISAYAIARSMSGAVQPAYAQEEDVCPGMEGIQLEVPEGYHLEDGFCVLDEPQDPVEDVCSNLDGLQPEVPEGYHMEDGLCVEDTPPEEDGWNKSSLTWTLGCVGDCEQIEADLCNNGDGDMTQTVSVWLMYAPSGNPKNGTTIWTGSFGPKDVGGCTTFTHTPTISGNYMWGANQEPGHGNKDPSVVQSLYSNACELSCEFEPVYTQEEFRDNNCDEAYVLGYFYENGILMDQHEWNNPWQDINHEGEVANFAGYDPGSPWSPLAPEEFQEPAKEECYNPQPKPRPKPTGYSSEAVLIGAGLTAVVTAIAVDQGIKYHNRKQELIE